jgi:hypothetical protein
VTVPRNACVEAVREQWELIAAADWDKVADQIAPDNFDDDRRSGMQNVYRGREAVLENLRAARDVGARLWSIEPIATHGENLALMRIVVGGADRESAFSAEMLAITFLAPDGRIGGGVVFDADAMDAAMAEFSVRASSVTS